MRPNDYMLAARVPDSVQPQEVGALWVIERVAFKDPVAISLVGFPSQTVLRRWTEATIMRGGEIVMEDSARELRKHLPIWMVAYGRVLITGLGLGCVVRGLLAKPEVTHIDVVELDADIIRAIGPEFADNPRVTIHHADALEFPADFAEWNFAWHDIWCEGNSGLDLLHARLFGRFARSVMHQGAWAFPRWAARKLGWPLLGSPKFRRAA
jgi:hypothetical protein